MTQVISETKTVERAPEAAAARAPNAWAQKIIYALVAIGIVLGCVSRFAAVDFKPVWGDESVTILAVNTDMSIPANKVTTAGEIIKEAYTPQRISVTTNLSKLYKYSREQLPLYYLGANGWGDFFGTSPTALRMYSSLIGALTIAAMYFLGFELFSSPLAGLLSAFFTAVSPFHFYYSRTARPYELFALTTAFSTTLLLRALRKSNFKTWAGYAMLAFATMMSHALSVAVLAAHGITVVCRRKLSNTVSFAVTAIVIGLSALPWYYQLNYHSTKYTGWLQGKQTTLIDHLLASLPTITTSIIDVFTNQSALVVLWGMCLLTLMAIFLWKKLGSRSLVLLTLIFCPIAVLLPTDCTWHQQMLSLDRYLTPIFIAVPLMLAGTAAFLSLSKKTWQHILAPVICAAALLQSGIFCNQYFSTKYWHQPDRWIGAVAQEISKSPDALVITNETQDQVISLCSMLPATVRVMRVDETPAHYSNLGQEEFFYLKQRHFRQNARLLHYSKTDGIQIIKPPPVTQ